MDIHKPKPWQGWPEFLKEIGTIVIGVLIALGAEQAVEWLHWRHEVGVAREAIRFDMKRILGWGGESDAEGPCKAARDPGLQPGAGAGVGPGGGVDGSGLG